MAMKNLTPASRYLRYDMTLGAPDTEVSHYIDLAKDLSLTNRRLYRQGRDYHVKKITIISSNTPNLGNRVSVSTIGDTWVARGAWKRGLKTYNLMNVEATSTLTNDISAKWADFKVNMAYNTSASTLTPIDNGGVPFLEGEWTESRYISPDGTTAEDTFSIHMLGNTVGSPGAITSAGLIESYAATRATVDTDQPNVPGTASEDPLLNIFDHGTTIDEVIDQLETHNDNPPYSTNTYPGMDTNGSKPIVVQDTTIVDGRASMAGFNALCGLLEFELKSALLNDVISVLIEIAPGNYRGVKAGTI